MFWLGLFDFRQSYCVYIYVCVCVYNYSLDERSMQKNRSKKLRTTEWNLKIVQNDSERFPWKWLLRPYFESFAKIQSNATVASGGAHV